MSLISFPNSADQPLYPPVADFPTGTVMTFQQTSAPIGWTKNVTHNDKAFRVVSGAAGSGGANNFSGVFGTGNAVIDGHVISQAELPSHTHGVNLTSSAPSVSMNHSHGVPYSLSGGASGTAQVTGTSNGSTAFSGVTANTDLTHAHNTIGNTDGGPGVGTAHTHTASINVLYVDLILATKN